MLCHRSSRICRSGGARCHDESDSKNLQHRRVPGSCRLLPFPQDPDTGMLTRACLVKRPSGKDSARRSGEQHVIGNLAGAFRTLACRARRSRLLRACAASPRRPNKQLCTSSGIADRPEVGGSRQCGEAIFGRYRRSSDWRLQWPLSARVVVPTADKNGFS